MWPKEEEVEEEEIVKQCNDESEVVDEELETGYDIEEDVNALLGGEELSEEFREKAKLIFESALNSKIDEITETLEGQYEQKLQEERNSLKVAPPKELTAIWNMSVRMGKTNSLLNTV